MIRSISIFRRSISSFKNKGYYSNQLASFEDWSKVKITKNNKEIIKNDEEIIERNLNSKIMFKDKFENNNWYAKLLYSYDHI